MCDCMREQNPHDCSCHRPTESGASENFPPFGNPGGRGRCHYPATCFGPGGRHQHSCSCHSLTEMTAKEEIQALEKQKKYIQDRIERIDKKIADLKPAQQSRSIRYLRTEQGSVRSRQTGRTSATINAGNMANHSGGGTVRGLRSTEPKTHYTTNFSETLNLFSPCSLRKADLLLQGGEGTLFCLRDRFILSIPLWPPGIRGRTHGDYQRMIG